MRMQNEGNKQAAEAGDPFAQWWYAHSFLREDSPFHDQAEGLKWLRKSSEVGHADGEIGYAANMKDSSEERLPLVRKAAHRGRVEAQLILDVKEVLGQMTGSVFSATASLQEAAKGGNLKAFELLCRYGAIFSGVTTTQALTNSQAAAKGGSAEAMLRLGMMYEQRMADFDIISDNYDPDGFFHRGTFANFYLGHDAGDYKRDLKQAQSWYEKAAKAGNAQGQARLARFLVQNLGGSFDLQKAMDWAKKSVAQDEPEGLAMAGLLLVNERLGDKDAKTGLDLLIRAAERGNAAAMTDLIVMYTHGQDVPRDLNKALAWAYLLQEEFDIKRATEGYTDYLLLLSARDAIADLKQFITPDMALAGRKAAQDLRTSLAKKGFSGPSAPAARHMP